MLTVLAGLLTQPSQRERTPGNILHDFTEKTCGSDQLDLDANDLFGFMLYAADILRHSKRTSRSCLPQ